MARADPADNHHLYSQIAFSVQGKLCIALVHMCDCKGLFFHLLLSPTGSYYWKEKAFCLLFLGQGPDSFGCCHELLP